MLKDITYYLKYIPKIGILVFLMVMSYLFLIDNGANAKNRIKELFKKGKWIIIFMSYSSLLLICTIFDRRTTNPYQYTFTYYGFITNGKLNWDTIQNIIVFSPYIYLYLKALKPDEPFRSTIILSIVTTIFIEFIQMIFWLGSFQFEDMIYNILGGLIGWGVWQLLEKIYSQYSRLVKK